MKIIPLFSFSHSEPATFTPVAATSSVMPQNVVIADQSETRQLWQVQQVLEPSATNPLQQQPTLQQHDQPEAMSLGLTPSLNTILSEFTNYEGIPSLGKEFPESQLDYVDNQRMAADSTSRTDAAGATVTQAPADSALAPVVAATRVMTSQNTQQGVGYALSSLDRRVEDFAASKHDI